MKASPASITGPSALFRMKNRATPKMARPASTIRMIFREPNRRRDAVGSRSVMASSPSRFEVQSRPVSLKTSISTPATASRITSKRPRINRTSGQVGPVLAGKLGPLWTRCQPVLPHLGQRIACRDVPDRLVANAARLPDRAREIAIAGR